MTFRSVVAIIAVGLQAAACFAGLSEGTPSRETVAFWRVSNPMPSSMAAWVRTQVTDTFVRGVAQFDEDPASAMLGRVSAWASTNGLPNTGVALMTTPEARSARATIAAAEIEKYESELTAYRERRIAKAKEKEERARAARAPGATPVMPGATPEEEKPESAPRLMLPPSTGKSLALEVVVREGARTPAEALAVATGLSVDTSAAPEDIAGVSVRKISADGWVRPLLWATTPGRLLVATDTRAMTYALSNASNDGDVLREDWTGQRAAVSEAREGAKPGAVLFVNFNAIRQELGPEFQVSTASRLLNAWRMPNVRSMSLHLGTMEPQAQTAASTAGNPVPLLLLDACWSAKSDAPGVCLRVGLSQDTAPVRQSAALVPDAQVLIVLRPDYRALADWIFRTHFARVSDDPDAASALYKSWRTWLGDHRSIVDRVGEGFGLWGVIGLCGVTDAGSAPVVKWRSVLKSGMTGERMTGMLATLTKWVGTKESAGPPKVWSVPVQSGWINGTVAWSAAQSYGVPVVLGSIAFGEYDPTDSQRRDAQQADVSRSKPGRSRP